MKSTVLLGGSFVITVGLLVGHAWLNREVPIVEGKDVESEGRLVEPQTANPGNPENAVKDLKRIYQALVAYREKHGKLPPYDVLEDTSKPLVDGIQLTPEDFENPDKQFSEKTKSDKVYHLAYLPFNHELIPEKDRHRPTYPEPGTKYQWAKTRIYERSNVLIRPDKSQRIHYSGFIVVLWSNGDVDVVPESKVRYVNVPENRRMHYYSTDPPTPPESKPITEYWKELEPKLSEGSTLTWEDAEVKTY